MINLSASSVSSEGLSPWLLGGCFLPLSLPLLITLDQGPTPMISFNLDYLLTGPSSRYSHILRLWGQDLAYKFEEDAHYSMTLSIGLVLPPEWAAHFSFTLWLYRRINACILNCTFTVQNFTLTHCRISALPKKGKLSQP